jgi:uncharacterized protein (DUF2252 family)
MLSIAHDSLPIDHQTPDHHSLQRGTVANLRAAGKALRKKIPRLSHAEWSAAADRPNPVSLLEEQNRTRFAHLVPIRYERMTTSPFAFLRGSAVVMTQDLASTPVSGIRVQLCGDAHLNNFGIYATPERNQIFDLNDFDETLPGPWEWDVKRLAASIIVAGRNNGFPGDINRQAALSCLGSYRQHMWAYSEMRYVDIWYSRIDYASSLQAVRRTFRWWINKQRKKSSRRTHLELLPKLTREIDGSIFIKDDPPLITHLDDDELAQKLRVLVEEYKASLRIDRQVLLNKYRLVDIAHKVVGIGSVGTQCYIALLMGSGSNDPIFLQIKEAGSSVLERYLGQSSYAKHGERVINGQRLMQAVSGTLLGWASLGSIDFYLRQLRDMKLSVDLETLSEDGFIEYCRFCGWALARAHARSGDPTLICSYLGKKDVFDQAIAAFAEKYADQTERDHAALVAYVQAIQTSVLS